MDKVNIDDLVSLSEFNQLFKPSNGDYPFPGLRIKNGSIWLDIYSDEAISSETLRRKEVGRLAETIPANLFGDDVFGVVTEHPQKDETKPLLTFPCTRKELSEFIVWSVGAGFYFPDDDAHHEVKRMLDPPRPEDVVADCRARGLDDKGVAGEIDSIFVGKNSLSHFKLGKLLVGPGITMERSSLISRGQRARGKKT